ncbi:MAG: PilZ domain-containing protein [Phycisphaerales bacterium]|nr:PilZ domain-containing protein [Phycisphaerales bacterium]
MTQNTVSGRRHPRMVCTRWGKVFHHPTRRYLPARTLDVSLGGSLLTIDTPRELRPGESVDLYVSWLDEPIVGSESLLAARVVRTHASDGYHQTVGVQFDAPLDRALPDAEQVFDYGARLAA